MTGDVKSLFECVYSFFFLFTFFVSKDTLFQKKDGYINFCKYLASLVLVIY